MLRKALTLTLVLTMGPGPLQAGDDQPSANQLAAHPEVVGALKVIDAAFAGAHHYDDVPGMSAGIVLRPRADLDCCLRLRRSRVQAASTNRHHLQRLQYQ